MASIQEAIKRLTWMFTSTGADKVADDLNKVGAAQANVAASAQTTAKASLDLEKTFDSLERRYVSTVRAQQDFEKVQNTVNAAVKQHPELLERGNVVMEAMRAKLDAAKGAATGFNAILEAGRGALLGYAAGIGPIGALLGSFGPLGVAAAAGIGIVVAALDHMNEVAAHIGAESSGIKQFADTTGLTITQVRGLNDAGSSLGVTSDQMASALQKFTFNLSDARKGGGELYDQLRVIDSQLAEDVSNTHDSAQALDLLTKAYNSTTDATAKAAISRAAFGKGGAAVGPVLGAVGEAGGVDAYSASVAKALGVTSEWTREVARLRDENKSLEGDLKLIEGSVYTAEMLDRQNRFLKQEIDVAKAIRDKAQAAKEYLSSGGSGPQADEFGNAFDFSLLNANKKPFAQGGDPVVDSGAIDKAKAATEGLAQAQRDNLDATTKMAAASSTLVAALGDGATAAEKEQARIDALTVSFESGKISAETYGRALETDASRAAAQVTAIQEAWGGVSQSTALALNALQAQLPIAEARTNSAKLLAQYEATYNDLLLKGKTTQEAAAIASKQQDVAVANQVASAQKLVQSSEDNLDKIRAQGTELEGVVASSIAYRDALQSGATATQAAAIAANTLQANLLQASKSADQLAMSEYNAKTAADYAAQAKFGPFGQLAAFDSGNGNQDFKAEGGDPKFNQQLRDLAQQQSLGIAGNVDQSLSTGGGLAAALAAAMNAPNTLGANPTDTGILSKNGYDLTKILGPERSVAADKITAVDNLTQLQNAQTTDKGVQIGNLQKEMAWLNTLPETIARDQKIVSLQQSIDQLKNSTDANTAATSATLNPLYSQGHGALAIGYYKAAGGLDMVAQGPTSGDQIPFHAMINGGERVQITPKGQSGNDNSRQVINNNSFVFNNASTSNARRSFRQFSQGFGQLAAAGS